MDSKINIIPYSLRYLMSNFVFSILLWNIQTDPVRQLSMTTRKTLLEIWRYISTLFNYALIFLIYIYVCVCMFSYYLLALARDFCIFTCPECSSSWTWCSFFSIKVLLPIKKKCVWDWLRQEVKKGSPIDKLQQFVMLKNASRFSVV